MSRLPDWLHPLSPLSVTDVTDVFHGLVPVREARQLDAAFPLSAPIAGPFEARFRALACLFGAHVTSIERLLLTVHNLGEYARYRTRSAAIAEQTRAPGAGLKGAGRASFDQASKNLIFTMKKSR